MKIQGVEGVYDVRKGAAGYAQIVATFGALSAPTIFIVLGNLEAFKSPQGQLVAIYALGCLVVSLLGSLAGAMSLAAVGAEGRPTANLSAAVLWAGVPTVVSLTSLVAAFETLASQLLSESGLYFRWLVLASGFLAVGLMSVAVHDSLPLGPRKKQEWAKMRETAWIANWESARRNTMRVMLTGLSPIILAGIALMVLGHGLTLTRWLVAVVTGLGFVLVLLGTFMSAQSAVHTKMQKPLRPSTAYSSVLAASAFVCLLALTGI